MPLKNRSIILKADAIIASVFNLIEQKGGVLSASIISALIIYLVASIYVPPDFQPKFHGNVYSILSLDPFNFSVRNDLQYRIFTPFIAYISGLNGPRIVIVQHFFALALLISVFIHYRKLNYSAAESFYMAALLGFSGVLFIPLISPGYTDTTSFFLIFMAWISTRKPWLTATFVLMALLNHEANIFLIPALILKMTDKAVIGKIAMAIIPCLIAIGLYWLFRQYVSHFSEAEYTIDFYLSKANLATNFWLIYTWIPLGMFFAFKLFWFYPIHAIYYSLINGKFRQSAIIFMVIGCVFLQYFIAYDITRLMLLAFPAVLMGAETMRHYHGSLRFRYIILLLIFYSFLILQYFVTDSAAHPIYFDPIKKGWL